MRGPVLDIINNSIEKENENEEKKIEVKIEIKEIPKVKRCENPLKQQLEMMNDSYFDDLIDELNDLNCEGDGEKEN